jgi:hypothetical protein
MWNLDLKKLNDTVGTVWGWEPKGRGEKGEEEGMNLIKVFYMNVWEYNNKISIKIVLGKGRKERIIEGWIWSKYIPWMYRNSTMKPFCTIRVNTNSKRPQSNHKNYPDFKNC